jgi:hypothetical protein
LEVVASTPARARTEEKPLANGVSQSVLEALARALELDDAERAHLFDPGDQCVR